MLGPAPILGGAIGAVTGGAIGNAEDQREKQALENRAIQADNRAAVAPPMGIADVCQWAKAGRTDDEIINQIRATYSTFQLSAADIDLLRANSVSDRVINEMQSRRPAPAVVYPRRRYMAMPPEPVYIYRPLPPPPPAVGVGVIFHN